MAKRGTNQFSGKTQFDWLVNAITNHSDSDECLLWPGKTDSNGYVRIVYEGKKQLIHRIAYKLHHGAFPEPLGLHSCDTSNCFNWKHVNPGTQQQNIAQRDARGRTSRVSRHVGENNPAARMNCDIVMAIRRLSKLGVSMSQIAASFEMKVPAVSNIVHGKRWKHLPVFPPSERHGDQRTFRTGERNGNSKLSAKDVLRIRSMNAAGVGRRVIANELRVSRSTVARIIRGKTWILCQPLVEPEPET